MLSYTFLHYTGPLTVSMKMENYKLYTLIIQSRFCKINGPNINIFPASNTYYFLYVLLLFIRNSPCWRWLASSYFGKANHLFLNKLFYIYILVIHFCYQNILTQYSRLSSIIILNIFICTFSTKSLCDLMSCRLSFYNKIRQNKFNCDIIIRKGGLL